MLLLGELDLTRFVLGAFSATPSFNWDRFGTVVGVAVRMLDNVLEVTHWPLPEQRAEARNKRRIGLGFLGLGDALVMLGLRYDTDAARAFAAQVAERLRDTAYAASVALAKEKGAFALFDAEKYLAGGFARRLPEALREQIRLTRHPEQPPAVNCARQGPSAWPSRTTPPTASSRPSPGPTTAGSARPTAARPNMPSRTTPTGSTGMAAATSMPCRSTG